MAIYLRRVRTADALLLSCGHQHGKWVRPLQENHIGIEDANKGLLRSMQGEIMVGTKPQWQRIAPNLQIKGPSRIWGNGLSIWHIQRQNDTGNRSGAMPSQR